MHGKSKEKTEINSEKELIETATVQAIGKNIFGNITVEELQKELEGDATVKKMRKKIVVTINESQSMYYVDENGNVYEYENHSLDVMEDGIDFYNRIEDYRDKIITVSVIDNMDVPENVYKVLYFSKKQNQSIKAWMVENIENKDMYDLYIGGNDGVEIENCSQLFSELQNCININLENLYTENVIDFIRIFY